MLIEIYKWFRKWNNQQKIIRELPSEVSSNQDLMCARRVQAQKAWREVLHNMEDVMGFDPVTRDKLKHDNIKQQKGSGNKKEMIKNYKYFSTGHLQRLCPAFVKTYSGCGKTNHFKEVWSPCRDRAKARGNQGMARSAQSLAGQGTKVRKQRH